MVPDAWYFKYTSKYYAVLSSKPSTTDCPQEAAASAGADAEERLREEMERERDLTLRAERLVSELEARQAKLSAELAGEGNVVAELRSRLDEVQVFFFVGHGYKRGAVPT